MPIAMMLPLGALSLTLGTDGTSTMGGAAGRVLYVLPLGGCAGRAQGTEQVVTALRAFVRRTRYLPNPVLLHLAKDFIEAFSNIVRIHPAPNSGAAW